MCTACYAGFYLSMQSDTQAGNCTMKVAKNEDRVINITVTGDRKNGGGQYNSSTVFVDLISAVRAALVMAGNGSTEYRSTAVNVFIDANITHFVTFQDYQNVLSIPGIQGSESLYSDFSF